jgi:hypothetical protein
MRNPGTFRPILIHHATELSITDCSAKSANGLFKSSRLSRCQGAAPSSEVERKCVNLLSLLHARRYDSPLRANTSTTECQPCANPWRPIAIFVRTKKHNCIAKKRQKFGKIKQETTPLKNSKTSTMLFGTGAFLK